MLTTSLALSTCLWNEQIKKERPQGCLQGSRELVSAVTATCGFLRLRRRMRQTSWLCAVVHPCHTSSEVMGYLCQSVSFLHYRAEVIYSKLPPACQKAVRKDLGETLELRQDLETARATQFDSQDRERFWLLLRDSSGSLSLLWILAHQVSGPQQTLKMILRCLTQ